MKGQVFDRSTGELTLGGRRLVVHCHHYNVLLQRSLEDALGARAVEIQRNAASESARLLLEGVFDEEGLTQYDIAMVRAASIFSELGFGRATFDLITEQLVLVTIAPSHYSVAWTLKWGSSSRSVEHWATGFFRGAASAAARVAPERVTAVPVREAAVSCAHSTHIRVEVA